MATADIHLPNPLPYLSTNYYKIQALVEQFKANEAMLEICK